MTLKFLPLKSNKIETGNMIGFDAYYDKNTLTWKSTGSSSNFLIEHAVSSENLNIKASFDNAENEPITWVNSLGINTEGFIDSGLGFIERHVIIDSRISPSTFTIEPSHNQMSFHFINPCIIHIPDNPDLREGFGCYLMKDGNLTEAELVRITIAQPNLKIAVGQTDIHLIAIPVPIPQEWVTTANSRPALLKWNRVYLHKINSTTWVISFGIVENDETSLPG